MANTMNGAQRDAKRQKRLTWLIDRPSLLARLPGTTDDVEDDGSAALVDAQRGLMQAGLYAPTTRPDMARWGIRALVSELRRR